MITKGGPNIPDTYCRRHQRPSTRGEVTLP
jgi:hypothetical protein